MLRVMIDEETLGTRPGDVILSLGACTWDDESGRFGDDRFHVVISLEASLRLGLKTEKSTIDWWRRQKPEAQAVLFDALVSTVTPEQACHDFAEWLDTVCDARTVQVWGNGASFDNVLLDALYRAAGVDRPWGDFNDRCFRTLKDGYRDLQPKREGVHHNALDDALHQAEWACAIAAHKRAAATLPRATLSLIGRAALNGSLGDMRQALRAAGFALNPALARALDDQPTARA